MNAVYTKSGVAVASAAISKVWDEIAAKLTIKTEQLIGPAKVATMYRHHRLSNGQEVVLIPTYAFENWLRKYFKNFKIDCNIAEPRPLNGPFAVKNLTLHNNQVTVCHSLRSSLHSGNCVPHRSASLPALHSDDESSSSITTNTTAKRAEAQLPERSGETRMEEQRNEGKHSFPSGAHLPRAALLCLRAGMGKTFVAAEMIAQLDVRTLYIVPKKPLQQQVLKDLKAIFPAARVLDVTVKAAEAGVVPDIGVAVINTALKLSKDYIANFDFVIYDEVHMYCSSKRADIFWKTTVHYRLGMTATPDERADRFDEIYHAHLGPTINAEEIEGFTYDNVKFDCDVEVIKYKAAEEYSDVLRHETTGYMFMPYMNKLFFEDEFRVNLIVDKVAELYAAKHCIYVFCEELGIVDNLIARVASRLNLPQPSATGNDKLCRFVGGNKLTDSGAASIYFATYGYASTGVSIDKMTAIVFATPRKSNMKQILARILRRGGDTAKRRKIVDIVDSAVARQYSERRAAYEFYGMTIKKIKIKAPD